MAKNSFLHPVNEVRFGTYKVQDVKDAVAIALKQASDAEKAILKIANANRTYENTIQALNDSSDRLDFIEGIVGHLAGMLGDPWNKADEFVSEKYAGFMSKRGLNKKIYEAICVIWDKQAQLKLTDTQIRLVRDYKRGFERSGIALPIDQKNRLKAINKRLAKLSSLFERHATQGNDKAHLIVKNESDLAGVDTDLIGAWQKLAKEKKVAGYYIPFSAPNSDAILRGCDVQKTRKAFHKMAANRAPKNEKLIYETLALRNEKAALLGYKNFVDYVVENRMAKNSKNIAQFNDRLFKTFRPAMQKDMDALKAYIRKSTDNAKYELDVTDVVGGTPLYYAQKMSTEHLGVDEDLIREYLPLDQVVNTMFKALGKLYGYTFEQTNVPTPHKDGIVYRIFDEKKRHLATIWCDWYARTGKRAGAWCNTFYEPTRANDKVDEPLLGLVSTNLKPPTKNKPSLLTIRDAETVWHEFGHFIHATSSKTELREQGGFHTKWDFVEAPSQIMENWIWTDEILSDMAKHYKTKKPLPKSVVKSLRDSRSFWSGPRVMFTLHWSTIDQMLHTQYDPKKDGSIFEYCQAIKSKFFVADIPTYDHTICNFTHIFAGGYYGAYYSYQWAEVIEADLFSRFEKEGVLNPKTGRDYRDKVLARGDEVDPDVLVRDFLGRDSTPDALLRRSGL